MANGYQPGWGCGSGYVHVHVHLSVSGQGLSRFCRPGAAALVYVSAVVSGTNTEQLPKRRRRLQMADGSARFRKSKQKRLEHLVSARGRGRGQARRPPPLRPLIARSKHSREPLKIQRGEKINGSHRDARPLAYVAANQRRPPQVTNTCQQEQPLRWVRSLMTTSGPLTRDCRT